MGVWRKGYLWMWSNIRHCRKNCSTCSIRQCCLDIVASMDSHIYRERRVCLFFSNHFSHRMPTDIIDIFPHDVALASTENGSKIPRVWFVVCFCCDWLILRTSLVSRREILARMHVISEFTSAWGPIIDICSQCYGNWTTRGYTNSQTSQLADTATNSSCELKMTNALKASVGLGFWESLPVPICIFIFVWSRCFKIPTEANNYW